MRLGEALNSVSTQQNPTWQPDGCARTQNVVQAIKTAAPTGTGFDYLLRTARLESGLNPAAQSSTSSAAGLFQFTEQTWLRTMKAHGAEHGLGSYAAQIQTSANGTAYIDNPASKQAVLDLRKDPAIATQMAGELNISNAAILQKTVGGNIGPTELYLAHFLGTGGAGTLLKARRSNPNVAAADLVPAAAKANSSIFYDSGGQPLSVGQVYQHFASKLDQPMDSMPHLSMASAYSIQQASPAQTASSFASLLLAQTNLAEVAAALMLDDENGSTVSVSA